MSVRGGDLTGNRTARVQQLLGNFSRDEFVDMLISAGAGREWAQKQADARYGSRDSIQAKELEADALEKAHVAEGDRIVRALGGVVWSFSQPRASKQTPGIPDRKYYFPRHGLTFWWEAKAEWGEQSPAQKDRQREAEACREAYVCGELQTLKNYLVCLHLCTINPDGSLEPVRQPEA